MEIKKATYVLKMSNQMSNPTRHSISSTAIHLVSVIQLHQKFIAAILQKTWWSLKPTCDNNTDRNNGFHVDKMLLVSTDLHLDFTPFTMFPSFSLLEF